MQKLRSSCCPGFWGGFGNIWGGSGRVFGSPKLILGHARIILAISIELMQEQKSNGVGVVRGRPLGSSITPLSQLPSPTLACVELFCGEVLLLLYHNCLVQPLLACSHFVEIFCSNAMVVSFNTCLRRVLVWRVLLTP